MLIVICLLIWYCRRRAHQSAIDDALRNSQSYINSTSGGITHTLHSDGTVTRNTISSKSLSSQDQNGTTNSKNSGGHAGQTPQSNDIVVGTKLELISPPTESPNVSGAEDSDSDKNSKQNRDVPNIHESIVHGSEKPLTKDTSQDALISSSMNSTTNNNSKAIGGNKNNSKKNNTSTNHVKSAVPSKTELKTNKSMTGTSKIVKLKKGKTSEILESENENDSDPSIDENDEINKILNEDIDDNEIRRLTLHKKLSNINVRSRQGDTVIDVDDDDDEDDDSLNDDLIDVDNNTALNSGQGIRNKSNTLSSPPNKAHLNSGYDNSTNSKHRRMVSQEEIDYFEKMKDETLDDTRDYRSRTISTTANRPTNMNANLIDKK